MASQAEYIEAIRKISYNNSLGSPNTTNRIITTVLNDGAETGPASTTTIVIVATPRINVTGNGNSIADGTTTTDAANGTGFGTFTNASAPVTHSFVIENVGTGIINLLGTPRVSITGAAGFSVSAQPSAASLNAGANTAFEVSFNPALHTVGNFTATVVITNDDPNAQRSVYTFAVSASLNNLPVITNSTLTSAEDANLNIYAADFSSQFTDIDGASLARIRIDRLPLNGSFRYNGTPVTVGQMFYTSLFGNFVFTPTADWNGSTSFDWSGHDGTSFSTASATITIDVTPENDAPTVTGPVSLSANENTPVSLSTVSFGDVDALTGVVTATFSATEGGFTATSNASVTVGGTAGACTLTGTLSDINTFIAGNNITYSATDRPSAAVVLSISINDNGNTGAGGSLQSTYNLPLSITAQNDLPVGTNGSETTNEDTPLDGSVTATDPDGDALTFTKATDPSHGTVVVNSDGTYTYTPSGNYHGADQFTVTVSDGTGGTATITVDVTVTSVNDVPVGTNDAKTTNEDTPVNGTMTATDADGDALTYVKATDPSHGTVVVNSDGTYTYTPSNNYHGADQFTVTVSDGNGGTATITVDVTVTAVNDVPVGTTDTKTTNEDTPVDGALTATDADGDALTYVKASDPSHGTVVVNTDGTYTYTPSGNYHGADQFTVTVSDGNGGTATITVDITVTSVNDVPVGTNGSETTNEDTPVNGAVAATDVDGDALTYAKATDPSHGTVTVNSDGTYTYTPSANYHGADQFTVTVSDGNGGTATITVDVTVTSVNDVPVGTNDSQTTNEDTPVNGAVAATDVDGDALTYAKATDPSHGTVTVNSDGTYTYTPSANYHGADQFTVTVSDGNGGTATITVDVTVTSVNDVPVGTNDSETTNEDTPVNGKLTATDADGDALTYVKASDPSHGTVVVNTDGTYTYTPSGNYHGADQFTVTVNDGNGGTATITVDITVTSVNDVPVGTNDSETTNEDTPVNGAVAATDVDGDALTYAKATDPSHGTVTVNSDGTYTYTPSANYHGADQFTVTVSDGNGGTATITVDVTVTSVNDAPVGTNGSETTNEDTPVNGAVTATDVDGDALTYTKATDPSHGTVTVNSNGTYTYTPNADYHGADQFTVTVSDGNGGTATITVAISVTAVNDVPVVTNDQRTTAQDVAVNGTVTATDRDNDPLTFTKGSDPSHGTVTVNTDGTYRYTPASGYSGSDQFTINVSDGQGGTAVATVSLTVTAGAPGVTMVKTAVRTGNQVTYSFTISNTGAVTLITVSFTDAKLGISNKVVDVNGGLAPGASVVITEVYTITDADRLQGKVSNTASVNATSAAGAAASDISGTAAGNDQPTVITLPPPPVANDDQANVRTNQSITINLLGNDRGEGVTLDPLSIEIVTTPQHGTVTINTDGTITYRPNAGFNGEEAFSYRVRNVDGVYSNTASVRVSVSFLNITVPNVFTPNGDGTNDRLEIRGIEQFADNELVIVNRWGNEVFRQRRYNNAWNGDGLNEGTYYYLLRVKRTASSEWEIMKGYITLIRAFKH
ncbi:Ig-like domain-containing protein [Chitinophaga horti]|uniref:Ig-like domain-containing protein n=1 Tax=Chitinophaga horti TaxID=2920382 RepID=A0ABY6JBJ1_9BACT|nr:Ig-like domain-containing protein [Chitinophaga horti]UYQ95762.1 Ig-like domain-containing protein [Chitinophaga horti]